MFETLIQQDMLQDDNLIANQQLLMDCLQAVANYFGFSLLAKLEAWEYRQFRDAVFTQNQPAIREMVQSQYNIQDGSQTILHYAIRQSSIEIFTILVDLLHEHLQRNGMFQSLLLEAIFSKKQDIVRLLIEKNYVDVNQPDPENGTTPVIAAAANGALDILKYLLDIGKANPLARNTEGQTALHRACFYSQLEIIEYLLNQTNLKITQVDCRGNNCCHMAAMQLNITCLRYLSLRLGPGGTKKLFEQQNVYDKSVVEIVRQIVNILRDKESQELKRQDIEMLIRTGRLPNFNEYFSDEVKVKSIH